MGNKKEEVFKFPIMFVFMDWKGMTSTGKQCQWIVCHFQAHRLALGGNSCGANPLGFAHVFFLNKCSPNSMNST